MVDKLVSRPWLLAGCVALVVGWGPTILFLALNVQQLICSTIITVIVFALIGISAHVSRRAESPPSQRLNVINSARLMRMASDERPMGKC